MINSNLVQIKAQQAFTTSLVISEQCPNEKKGIECKREHKETLAMIRRYKNELEQLGALNFQTRKGSPLKQGGFAKSTEYAELNEDQATFLITLFKNTRLVVAFKLKLVKEFRKAIDEINRLYANPPRISLLQDKRHAHNPMMNALIEMRDDQGKKTEAHHFQCENKLCNGVVTGNYKTVDEKSLSNEQIELLALVRKRNEAFMLSGFEYKERKVKLIAFATKYRTKLISSL